jgi:hypothetical protein
MFGNKETIKIKLILDEFEFEFFEGSLKEMLKVIKNWKKLKPDLRGYADYRINQYNQPYGLPQPPIPPQPTQPIAQPIVQPQPQPAIYQYYQQQPSPQPEVQQQPTPKKLVKKAEKVPDEIPPLNIPQSTPIIPPRGRTVIKVR